MDATGDPARPSTRIRALGVDACRAGWVVAAGEVDLGGHPGAVTISVVPDFAAVVGSRADRIVVDMPIGLPEAWEPGGRACDVAARAVLGPGRGPSVFAAPPRPALDLVAFDDPRRADLGLTAQAFAILPRIREVDALVAPEQQDPAGGGHPVILEGHPEVIFADLNGGAPLPESKRSAEGRRSRRTLLEARLGRPIPVVVLPGAAEDDVLDALACLWVAAAPTRSLSALPSGPARRDGRGLEMRIWRRDAVARTAVRRRAADPDVTERILGALGPVPGVTVTRRSRATGRTGDLRLETAQATAIVEVDGAGGLEHFARHWPELREAGRSRRYLLLHLLEARPGIESATRDATWDFLVERMEEDLARQGTKRPRHWDAARLAFGHGPGAADPIPEVVARVRRVLGLEPLDD
jgi:predicted RNase H-like nuclease